jgi:uncharacterized protein (DUF983 family)
VRMLAQVGQKRSIFRAKSPRCGIGRLFVVMEGCDSCGGLRNI